MIIDPYRYAVQAAGGGGGGGDPHFANVSMLLHLNGANGGTSFIDSSSNALSLTTGGGPVTSTTDPKFGSASLRVNGSSFIGRIGSVGDVMDLGGGDFTIEGWFKIDSPVPGAQAIFSLVDVDFNPLLRLYDNTGFALQTSIVGSNAWASLALAAASYGAWHSFAVVRSGVTGYLFIDGVGTNTTGAGGDWAGTPVWPAALAIGASSNLAGFTQFQLTGNVDEFRVTKGVARYTANYTPSLVAFPDN